MASSRHPVSWTTPWRVGLAVALTHRALASLAILAVFCERFIAYWLNYSGSDWAAILRLYGEIQPILGTGSFIDLLAELQRLEFSSFGGLALSAGAFFLGLFILIGLVGLLRDLLRDKRYQPRNLLARGRRYFWPVMKFKVPLYCVISPLVGGFAVLALLQIAARPPDLPAACWSIAASIVIFFVARIYLSLGPKIIICEAPRRNKFIYSRVGRLLRSNLGEVLLFYIMMLAFMFVALGMAVLCAYAPGPLSVRVGIELFVLGFATLVMKTAALSLYLHLADEYAARVTQPRSADHVFIEVR